MRSRPKLTTALFVVLGLVVGLLTGVAATVVEEPTEAYAIPAPTFPTPECAIDENGNQGLGCVPGPVKGVASGNFAAGNSFTINTQSGGIQPCVTYVSTGCYYSLQNPSFVRCVYLHEGDAFDVRSCSGSLSTEGWVSTSSAQRQGRCSGALGGTYAYGGDARYPETWWNARAVGYAACQFDVSDTHRIDNLQGPTFILVRTSVRECIEPGGGFGCDESWATLATRNEWGWLPVEGDLAPKASFTPELTSGPDVTYRMKNTSTPFATGTTTYEWSFGDGTTAEGQSPSHRYESYGTYTIRLTMRSSEGPTRTATERVEFEPPDLSINVSNPDAEFGPGKQGNRYNIDDEFTVRVFVKATDGYGSLVDVAPVSQLLTLPEQLELVGAPISVVPATFGPGDDAEYEVRVKAVKPGRATIRSSWAGKDSAGGDQGPWNGEFNVSVTGLKVEVLPDPAKFKVEDTNEDGDIDENDDNEVAIEVKVTNVTDSAITDVTHAGLTVTSLTDDLFVQFPELERPTDDTGTPGVDESQFGDIPAGESKSLTWTHRADEPFEVEVSTTVTGNADGATITARGDERIQAQDVVLLEGRISLDQQTFRSGTPVKVSGTFKNVTDDDEEPVTISFAIAPDLSSAFGGTSLALNGAAGYFGRGGATPTGIERFRLTPGESISLSAIVPNMETDQMSGFRLEYIAVVAIEEVDDDNNVTWDPQGQIAVDLIKEGPHSPRHDVSLGTVKPLPEVVAFLSCDPDAMWMATYWGCQLSSGVFTAIQGFGDLAQIAWAIAKAPAAATGWVLGTMFVMMESEPEVRQAIRDEIIAEMRRLKELGHEALKNINTEDIALYVPRMLDETFRKLGQAWDAGAEVFIGELARIAGENIDMVFEALVAARAVAKASKALAKGGDGPLATKMQQAWVNRRDKGFDEIDEIARTEGYSKVPESRALPGGVDVTNRTRMWQQGWGLSEKNFEWLAEIADSFNVNIVLRSRASEAIDLIRRNVALPKPQGIKTKGVNAIDIEFLDYPSKYKAVVVHMQPPIPFDPDPNAMRAAAEAYADAQLRAKRPGLDAVNPKEFEDLKAQIASRVETRAEEWVKRTPELADGLKRQPNGEIGVKVDFDPEFNGLARDKIEREPLRPIQVIPAGDVNGRAIYEVKLKAPDGHPEAGKFLDVTGDIDFLAILKPDGTVLGANGDPTELANRVKIYKAMQALVGMQHGESFTIFNNKKVRAKYVRDGVDGPGGETLLAVTPQKRLVTTYFNDGLSTLKGGPSSQLGELQQARAFFSGIFSEHLTPGRPISTLILDELARARRALVERLPTMFNLNILRDLVVGDPSQEATTTRGGKIVRPTPAGEIEQYLIDAIQQNETSSNSLQSDELVRGDAASTGVLAELEQIIAGLESSGVDYSAQRGALGGRWVPVELDEVTTNGRLEVAPFAFLKSAAAAGDTEIDITTKTTLELPAGAAFFEVGDRVIFDPGGLNEERATVASVEPFRLTAGLKNDHVALSSIVLDPTPPSVGGSVVPVSPARLVDTRDGQVTVDGQLAGVGVVQAGTSLRVPVHGRGGVPASASAVVVNTVAVRPSGPGFLTLYPCDEDRPSTSSVNYGSRPVDVNNALVKLSADGALCVYAKTDTHVVMDVTAFAEGSEALAPKRLAESRLGQSTDDGQQAGFGRVSAESTTTIQVAGRGGVPADAAAVAVNVTAVRPSGPGFLTLFPCDEGRPNASNLNYGPGDVRPNAAVVALSGDGTLCVFSKAETDLIVDVTASFETAPSFTPLNPARLLETRRGNATVDGQSAGGGRLVAGSVTKVQVAGRGGVPGDASTAAVNLAAVRPSGPGFITLYPCDEAQPTASSMNYVPGDVIANSGVVKLAADGSVCVFTKAETDLVMDVNAAWTS